MRQKFSRASKLRKVPEIFWRTFIMCRSRSAWLFEGDGEVVEEREDARGVVEEIEGFALLATALAFGCAGRLGSGILCIAFFDDAIVSSKKGDFFGVGEGLEIGSARSQRGHWRSNLVALVGAVEAKDDALTTKLSTLDQLKKYLMHDLPSGRVQLPVKG
jgi:hypothetical protein